LTAPYARELHTIEAILDRGGDADDVLRAVVDALHRATGSRVAIAFVEEDDLVSGPAAGAPADGDEAVYPIRFGEARVAELRVTGPPDEEPAGLLERVAALLGPFCLVGWDTGGERWDP
jgi:hypothetical protein